MLFSEKKGSSLAFKGSPRYLEARPYKEHRWIDALDANKFAGGSQLGFTPLGRDSTFGVKRRGEPLRDPRRILRVLRARCWGPSIDRRSRRNFIARLIPEVRRRNKS